MRYGEIRQMRWNRIDFSKEELRVGSSETKQGEGRIIPLSPRVRILGHPLAQPQAYSLRIPL